MNAPSFSLRSLALAAALVLPVVGFAQTPLYQWNFDPSGSLAPTSTNGSVTGGTLAITNAGTATSSTVNSAGVSGASGDYALDASSTTYAQSNYTTITSSLGSFPTLNALTVTMWIKAADWSASINNARLLELNSAPTGMDGDKLYFSVNANGFSSAGALFQAGINQGGGSVSNGTLMPNSGSSWLFVSMTWDSTLTSGSNISVFMGNTTTSVAQAGTAFGAYTNAMTSVTSVSIANRSDGIRGFDGLIDDVRIYDSALSSGQLEAIRVSGISAIPEPSTYGIVAGGLALVGAMVACRRRANAAKA
ncbi:MAG: PEP-CTERM sorting domain-containing protein [Verrucomicrobia bacterium]|nr:PEP-CTERM sorting domain-containing protein [Verrucomicrobiota bacterium]